MTRDEILEYIRQQGKVPFEQAIPKKDYSKMTNLDFFHKYGTINMTEDSPDSFSWNPDVCPYQKK